jgi:hypothetical protein
MPLSGDFIPFVREPFALVRDASWRSCDPHRCSHYYKRTSFAVSAHSCLNNCARNQNTVFELHTPSNLYMLPYLATLDYTQYHSHQTRTFLALVCLVGLLFDRSYFERRIGVADLHVHSSYFAYGIIWRPNRAKNNENKGTKGGGMVDNMRTKHQRLGRPVPPPSQSGR